MLDLDPVTASWRNPTDKSEATTTDELDVPTGMLEVAVCQHDETQPKAQLFLCRMGGTPWSCPRLGYNKEKDLRSWHREGEYHPYQQIGGSVCM